MVASLTLRDSITLATISSRESGWSDSLRTAVMISETVPFLYPQTSRA